MSEQFLRDVESNINKLHEKNADLKAENQRLREALLELENYIDAYYVSVYHDIVNEAHKHSNDNSVLLEDK